MNNQIFFFFYNLAHQSVFMDGVILFCALYLPYLVSLSAFVFLLFHHEVLQADDKVAAFIEKKKEILISFFSGAIAWTLAHFLKEIFLAPRPFRVFSDVVPLLTKVDHSFPSGHATFYMALAFSIFLSHKKVGSIFIFFAIIIGIARIASGVHFPVDILGGFILGIIIASFVEYIDNFLLKKFKK
ncbi:MAG: phosphatase PAP2 family protein [Patescibacteria group bacterium]